MDDMILIYRSVQVLQIITSKVGHPRGMCEHWFKPRYLSCTPTSQVMAAEVTILSWGKSMQDKVWNGICKTNNSKSYLARQ